MADKNVIALVEEFDRVAVLYQSFLTEAKQIASSESIRLLPPEGVRILRLAAKSRISNSELLTQTGWQAAHISQRTSLLISAGLIGEVPDENDRRKRSFTITPSGEKALNDIDSVLERALLSALPAAKGRSGLLLGAMRQVSGSTKCSQGGGRPADACDDSQLTMVFENTTAEEHA